MTTDLVQQLLDYPKHANLLQQSLEEYVSKPYVIINPYIIETCALITRYRGIWQHNSNNTAKAMLEKISRESNLDMDYLTTQAGLLLENPVDYKQNVYKHSVARYLEQIADHQDSYKSKCESVRQIMDIDYKSNYSKYDFSFIIDNWDRKKIEDHWKVVEQLNLQEFFSKFTINNYDDLGDPGLKPYSKHLLELGYDYSGQEYIYCCRKMHDIATDWNAFVESYISEYAEVLDDLSQNMKSLQIY